MATPGPTQTQGKQKGKSKKVRSTEDGAPGGVATGNSQTNLKPHSKTEDAGAKDKQQKKADKQSKSPKSKLEAGDGQSAAAAGGAGGGAEQPAKSKAQLKAERRAIQERQRALKEAKKTEGGPTGGGAAAAGAGAVGGGGGASGAGSKKDAGAASKKEKLSDGAKAAGAESSKAKKSSKADYNHLCDEQQWQMKEKEMLTKGFKIDEGICNLGFQYFHHKIVGANARCVALLTTLKDVISKYKTPEEKELSRDLEKNFLAPCIKYINDCRPLSTSMGNAIKHLKQHISQIPQGTEDDKAIAMLHEVIDNFIYDNIVKAAEAVATYADCKIDNGDVILVYAASSLIGQVLKYAHDKGKQFRVIVVEGRPRTEGKTMLRYLVKCGIPCSYIYIGSATHAMRETTKVFLGACAMFAIGDMHSRTGNTMIAALAKANNIPVLVCCETYKFTDKVQLPSSNANQQARGKDLTFIGHRTPIVPHYESINLHLLNLMYDVTPSGYITALVTELGMLPCTSVPVVLRRQEDMSL